MNLEALKKRIRNVTALEWQGETIYLRKIGAPDGIALLATIKGLSSQELSEEQDRKALIDYYSLAVSKSLSNANGDLELDSDEGRATLGQLPFSELNELGNLVLRHNGFTGEKKKYTELELFSFRLCLAFGDIDCPHPDALHAVLTWEQLADWQRYFEQEPWGESRADMRAAANSLWARSSPDDAPDLFHPYFDGTDPNELAKRARLLDAKVAEIKSNGQ